MPKKEVLLPNKLTRLAREMMMFDSFDDFAEKDIIDVLRGADELYHNDNESYLADSEYDTLRRYAETSYPTNPYFAGVGSDVRGGKVKLPYQMGSLDQVYEGQLETWKQDNNIVASEDFLITDKLDGASAMVVYKNGVFTIAYSRGNGVEGADITRHLRRFRCIPIANEVLPSHFVVRGEVILSKPNFELLRDKVLSRGKTPYKNARNMVSGLMNAETNQAIVYKYLDFIAYDIVSETHLSKDDQIDYLHKNGFMVPIKGLIRADNLTEKKLTSYLKERRNFTDYEIDGLVVDVNSATLREKMNPTTDDLNPAYAFKFKVADATNLAIAEVVNIEWNISKSGYLKPRVQIKPVQLVGVTVQNATGFNAKFIYDNSICPGAKVKITRSGDVIPFITEVVVRGAAPQMPHELWKWNETNVDAVLVNPFGHNEVAIQQALDFFASIEAPNLKEGTVREMFQINKYKDVTQALIHMINLPRGMWVALIGENGNKIYDGLRAKLSNIPLYEFMGSTPYFGRGVGVRKMKKLVQGLSLSGVPSLMKLTAKDIVGVEGFDEKTATKILDGMDSYTQFYACVLDHVTFAQPVAKATSGSMLNQKVCFTGVRSAELEAAIVAQGGEISSSVSKHTTYLVAADPKSNSGKMKKARDLGCKVVSLNEMKELVGS